MAIKRHPNHISSLEIHQLINNQTLVDKEWQPVRPISCPTLRERIYLSWLVFTGRADALSWPNQ